MRDIQLNEFFENGMTPAEEQNFLISVAASDELRIAFRSQLELMKAVRADKDALGRTAQVRNRTLAALGLSATAATQFLEHGLLEGQKGHAISSAGELVAESASIEGVPGMRWAARLLHAPALLLAAGIAVGILSTTALDHFEHAPAPAPTVVATAHTGTVLPAESSAPANTNLIPKPLANIRETIPAKNSLHTIDKRMSIGSGRHVAPVVAHAASTQHSVKAASADLPKAAQNPAIPVVSKTAEGTMHSRKLKITQENNSTKATK